MVASGFSKVGNIEFEDEDDELRRLGQNAHHLFKKAETQYMANASKEEVLQMFMQAEAAMAPLLANGGLMGLSPADLEPVLKGKLHQAVILASLEDQPDRWTRIKAHAEAVLQFDFGNCHARWLRGLALQATAAGGSRAKEAEEELRRAVECARTLGKTKEAEQWTGEIERMFGAGGDAAIGVGESEAGAAQAVATTASASEKAPERSPPEAAPADAGLPAAPAAAKPSEKQTAAAKARAKAERQPPAAAAAGLQKGFFQRHGKKSSEPEPVIAAPAKSQTAAPADATASASSAASASVAPAHKGEESKDGTSGQPTATAAPALAAQAAQVDARQLLQDEARQLLVEQRRQLEEHRKDLEEARQQLRDEREQAEKRELQRRRSSTDLQDSLDRFAAEFEEALAIEASTTSASSGVCEARIQREVATAGRTRNAITEAQAMHQAGKTWAEAQHQQYVELSAEVLTLRQTAAAELHERQDASRQQVAELKGLTKSLGDLKAATKSLRDNVRLRVAGAANGEEEEPSTEHIGASVADFRALPFSTKLAVLTDDAAVLRLAGLSALLGMLMMLGVCVEAFSIWRCRFVCSR